MTANKFHDCQLAKPKRSYAILGEGKTWRCQYPNFIVHYQICYAYFSSVEVELLLLLLHNPYGTRSHFTTVTDQLPVASSELQVASSQAR